jgi:hypothetical protein
MRYRSKSYTSSPWRRGVRLDESQTEKLDDRLLHNGRLMESIVRLTACDWSVLSRINHHLVASNRYFNSFFSEDVPKFLHEGFDSVLHIGGHIVIQDQVGVKLGEVLFRTMNIIEGWVWR